MKKNILLISNSSFIKKNYISYFKKKKNYTSYYIDEKNFLKKNYNINFKLKKINPDFVIYKGGLSGGILFNIKYSFNILNYNIDIYKKVLNTLKNCKIKNVFFISASCLFPKIENRSIKETDVLNGQFEKTNFSYSTGMLFAYALIKAINQIKGYNYINLIPATLIGNYYARDHQNAHVLTAMLRKFSLNKKKIDLYGDGSPRREFLHIDDLFDSIFFLRKKKIRIEILNVGTNKDYTIKQLAQKLTKKFNFNGKIFWDKTKPNGVKRKLLNSSFIKKLGWTPKKDTIDLILKTINV